LKEEALLAARLLQGAEIELLSTRFLFDAATRISIEIDHPAYDCLYLLPGSREKRPVCYSRPTLCAEAESGAGNTRFMAERFCWSKP
jgi:hypothetical protein